MPFIRSLAHQRFIQECKLFIQEFSAGEKNSLVFRSDKSQMLKEEVEKLQHLAEEYAQNFSKLPQLIREYQTLHHRIKVNIRQLQNLQKKMQRQQQEKLD